MIERQGCGELKLESSFYLLLEFERNQGIHSQLGERLVNRRRRREAQRHRDMLLNVAQQQPFPFLGPGELKLLEERSARFAWRRRAPRARRRRSGSNRSKEGGAPVVHPQQCCRGDRSDLRKRL